MTGDISRATRDNIVNRILDETDWFGPYVAYSVALPATVSLVLNDLVKEGQLEKRRNRGRVQYRWIN